MKRIILTILFISLLFTGCSDNSKKKGSETLQPKREQTSTSKASSKPVAKVVKKENKQNIMQKSADTLKKASDTIKKSASEVVEKTKELAKKAGDNKLVKEYAKKVSEGTKAFAAMVPTSITVNSKKSKDFNDETKVKFLVCAGCHGPKARKRALGVSKVIAGWDAAKIEKALNGYKNGTYGGSMKAIMHAQASKLSSDDIKAIAKYISSLK